MYEMSFNEKIFVDMIKRIKERHHRDLESIRHEIINIDPKDRTTAEKNILNRVNNIIGATQS
jgi:hypothetical protein